MSRVVCQFSCGAASAVATKLTLAEYPDAHIVNAFIVEEHPDNRRFLTDCETWFGKPVTVLRDTKYGASAQEVFRRRNFFKSQRGAPCSLALKRTVLDAYALPGDVLALGFTADARDAQRFDDLVDRLDGRSLRAPLIERGLTKADCLAMVERAGIELPMMYRMGYHNANCIGCVKGGEGYWNKVRVDFPETFEAMAAIQESIGPGANLFRDRITGVRFSLRELPPDKGRHDDEPDISCSFFCEMAEAEFDAARNATKGE